MAAWLLAAMLFASGADLISTEYSLANGAIEQNVFMANRAVRIAANLGFPIAMYFALRSQPEWMGKTIAAVHIGVKVYATTKNVYIGMQVRW